jgi:tetratricopeptide (TPR) repeat protein
MKRLLLLLLTICGATAADLEHAIQPLNDGVPQVAVHRLRALMESKPGEERQLLVLGKLGEALLAAGEAEEALRVLGDARLEKNPEAVFLRAQALAKLGRWSEALPLYQQSSGSEAVFGQAECFRALGRIPDALRRLTVLQRDERWKVRAQLRTAELQIEQGNTDAARSILEETNATTLPDRKERRFLRAHLEARNGNWRRAADLYRSVVRNPEGAAHPVLIASVVGLGEAYLQMGRPGSGDDYLEQFIENRGADQQLPVVFAKLDQLYSAQRRQTRHELGRWSNEAAQPRRALAQWYLARAELRMGRRDAALAAFAELQRQHPPVVQLAQGLTEYAELLLEDGRYDDAVAVLDSARALNPPNELSQRIANLAGRSHFSAGRYDVAAKTFRHPFNISLAWLQAGNPAESAAAAQQLPAGEAGDLALEAALVQAGKGEAAALQRFLKEHPSHARASEAWVALAEAAFHSTPPRVEEARSYLARMSETAPTPAAVERADYLAIWIEDASPGTDAERVIRFASQFLQKHSASPLVPQVRLKLAESSYRRQDFASAQMQFEQLARQNPETPLAEQALFFAGRAAMQSMSGDSSDRALLLFNEVVKRGGDLKWPARIEQAAIERRLGRPDDALTLYEEVLNGTTLPNEKWEALCGKGDVLFELGADDPENYRRAIGVYDQLANERGVTPHWRNQALFKKGTCLEKLNQRDEALATFYTVLEEERRPGRPREFFWFYKAGFNAARLLEEQSQWQPAAAIYEKLAFAGGTRSEEAKVRLDRLRLEHFLWEQ